MKTLSLVAAFLLLGITASHAIDTNKTDSSKNAYILAKREIEKMLDGTAPLSYERAIYLIENAWYDNHLNKDTFTSVVHGHESMALRIMWSNWHPPKDTVDFIGQRVDRTEGYAKAVANWAIFKYMTDTVHFKDGSFHAPYSYSAADPFGSIDWTNTQVSNLDRTGQGNCFALASMFKILSDRLGSEAMLCTAPSHIYIRHADEKGTLYNVEVGSRDFPGTGTISTLTYSTTESIRNDITLRDLDNEQAVALCLVYLAKGYEHRFGTKTDGFVLDCANATLKYDDHNLNAMLLKAEVLETRLAMQHRPIGQLRLDKAFISYENLIGKLYRLGYREIPPNMKNLLVRTYTMDSVRALQGRVYDGKTRYASLSWGMFDEAHDIKSTELYNHTVFNTVTKKIDSFTKPTNIYNSYNFDPVVFALNVDPMTHKMPSWSPYSFAFNNPISYIDKNGLYPVLTVTNQITGYTAIFVYGTTANPVLVVPTYRAILTDVTNGKTTTLATYNVTRDGYYNIGSKPNEVKLEDRSFEPKKEVRYTALKFDYVAGTPALALRQDGSKNLDATPLNNHTYTDGTALPKDIDRKDPNVASGVMIHIGGAYEHEDGSVTIGGTYGCMGVVNGANVYKTRAEAQKAISNGIFKTITSNATIKDLSKEIDKSNAQDPGPNKIEVVIKKRH